ncbi:MAG: alpha-L-arabinofuranosidase C-terminal domain-containing protein [Pyrinomonadaceae bacterium]
MIDEWRVWYPPGEEISPEYILSQPVTLRDALHTAITFDIFNRHAEKIAMANVAQTVNCLHSLPSPRLSMFPWKNPGVRSARAFPRPLESVIASILFPVPCSPSSTLDQLSRLLFFQHGKPDFYGV